MNRGIQFKENVSVAVLQRAKNTGKRNFAATVTRKTIYGF